MAKTEIGALLMARGLIGSAELESAIDRQRNFGGRLGTCLLEVGALREEELLEVLAGQVGYPPAHREVLQEAPSEVTGLLTPTVAINCSAVPFAESSGRVDVAMLDPGDLALEDELSFCLGKPLRAHVATELRIVDALNRCYGGDIPLRFRSLLDRLELHDGLTTGTEEHQHQIHKSQRSKIPKSLRQSSSGASRKKAYSPPAFEKHAIPLTAEEREALQVTATAVQPALKPPEPNVDPLDLGQQLSEAETASQIGAAILQTLLPSFDNVLLFRVSSGREEVNGWMSFGNDVDIEWFRHYSVGLHHATVFRQLGEGMRIFSGRLEATPAHQALARCWGGSLQRDTVIAPINVRNKLVCAIYADRGEKKVAEAERSFLEALARKASLAFERCILRRKLQTT